MSDVIDRLNAALGDRYAVERELGEGGMATVYLARDLKHNRNVALKVLKPELAAVVGAERFLAEIETTANLHHPHVLPLFDSGEADGFLFYVMPYVEGETLRERLNRDKQLPVDEAIRIATAVAHALQHAHDRGVIHRDIKPANILLQDGQPLVADFGIALAVGAAGGSRLTETGLSVGTPFYMSPEQATGDQNVGPQSDTYALAAVLYEMLTGDPPYIGSTAQAVLGKIIQGVPVSATAVRQSIPTNVDAAIRRALEKLPADRFTRAQDFAGALGDPSFRHGADGAVGAVGVGPWKGLTVAGWGAAAVLALALGWSLTSAPPSSGVLRYSLMEPDELDLFEQFGPTLAISQDGSAMVYASPGEGGGSELWIRERRRLEPRPLDGTQDAWQPFFSPDGRRVAFITGVRQLKIISLGGEPPLTVVDSGLVRGGGSWGPDGYIYFAEGTSAGNPTGGLGRVLATGGPIESVTRLDTTRAEVLHAFPETLPGGRGVLFALSREELYNPETMEIAVVDLATGEHEVLLQGIQARWSTTGHIIAVRDDGALIAAPFDEESLEMTGPAVPILDGVLLERYGGGTGLASSVEMVLSGSGTLVYQASTGPNQGAEWAPVWVGRDGTMEEIDPNQPRGAFADPTLSPDGRRLAVALTEAGETQVWIKQVEGGSMSKHTFQGSGNVRPTWHPDGRSLAFLSNRAGNTTDVWSRRADGSAPAELLLDEDAAVSEVTYTPDGEWLVYRSGNDLFAHRLGSDEAPVPLAVSGAFNGFPAISPDGRWLAYASNETGRAEVYVHPFPDTGDARWLVSVGGGSSPVWAHSGRELFYATLGSQIMSVPILEGETFVFEQPRELFQFQGVLTSPSHQFFDVTPDDQRFVMLQGTGEAGRFVVVENFSEELLERVGN